MEVRRFLILWCAVALLAGAAAAAPLTRAQAITALSQPSADARLAAVERLGQIGQAADADRVVERLHDRDARVRQAAQAAVWRLWSRSGDPKIDRLFARGLGQMQAAAFAEALATFDDIVRLKPAFAEGWNKRATVYFLLGQNDKSMLDCEEVFKRNPRHFGALSGAAQIQLQAGKPREALEFFRRALAVNPELEGATEAIPALEQLVREEDRKRI